MVIDNHINDQRRIYTLSGFPPEVVAVAFAKTSRSPEQLDKIAKELDEDKSRQFHEKWVVGYGHSSIAEHAVLSIAIENVSILATKVLEDNRLASYTEKSTRYQVFDKTRYYKPKKIMDSEVGKLYEETSDFIMDTYTGLFPTMIEFMKKKYPKKEDEPDNVYEVRIKNKALDNLRYLLPVSILTNLGVTINARQLEHATCKLLTHPLDEMNEIGQEIKEAALKVTPTLLKHVAPIEYQKRADSELKEFSNELRFNKVENKEGAVLVHYDKDAENRIIAGLIYRHSEYSYEQVYEKVKEMTDDEKEMILIAALKDRGKFDAVLREFENAYYTFDVLIDYGAFRDIQRHRICTQINQDFTVLHGYSMPPEILEAGVDKQFVLCMEKARDVYRKIHKKFLYEAQYIIPMAYRKRVLFTWNLRELHHFISLRSRPQGHWSYRRLAGQIHELLMEVHPRLAKHIRVDKTD